MKPIIVVGAAIISGDKQEILLVREKRSRFWIFPGGTLEEVDESVEQCLAREIEEELPDLQFKQRNFRILGIYPGQVSHGGRIWLIVYRVLRAGEKIRTDHEIKEAVFTDDPESFKLATATRRAIVILRQRGYLQ